MYHHPPRIEEESSLEPSDADDEIVLSDLVRTGEASRLRRRSAMRIDHTTRDGGGPPQSQPPGNLSSTQGIQVADLIPNVGTKTKMVSLMRSTAPTLTLVSGPRRGTPRWITSTTQRTSKRVHIVSSFIVAPQNLTYPLQQPLVSSPHYPSTHGGYHLPMQLRYLTAAALSSTWLQFPENDAMFG